ncbi:MAG TPA: FHA domain-containing protein [Galbitalea sp.]|nr:FHA domain-containing protein [Galbitalea sp.]
MDDELDETITVPRRPMVSPAVSPLGDLEDTDVPGRSRGKVTPPPLVEPVTKPRFVEPSGIELTAQPTDEDVSTKPYTRGEYDEATRNPQMFYRFRIGRTVVWLDAVSYVGRRPSSPRIIYGQMPRLVRVPSPRQEVSSTHVELRQLGASVVLTDMRSTNGSIVFPPGGEARKLRQGESVVATPGTLVDIGDGNVIEILPLESRPPSDEHSAGIVTEGRQ